MRHLLTTLLLLATGSALTADVTLPGTELLLTLPYYQLDPGDPAGRTTLWAVRNLNANPVTVRAQYYDEYGAFALEEVFSLLAHDTETRNVRDVAGIPSSGSVRFIAQNPTTSDVIFGALHGDFFFVEPGNAFASGGRLVDRGCREFHQRFFNGGPFSGGTDLVVYAPRSTHLDIGNPVLTASMYDEDGVFQGSFSYWSPRQVFRFNLGQSLSWLPTFGTIEWVFADGIVGHMMVEHRASGLYAVGIEGECVN